MVLAIETDRDSVVGVPPIRVVTARGTVRCSKLLLATNAYTAGLLPEFKQRITPCVGQVLVTEPVVTQNTDSVSTVFEHRGLTVTASLNRANPDGEYMLQRPADGRIVIGSDMDQEGSWDDSVSAIDPDKSKQLRSYLRNRFTGEAAETEPDKAADAEWVGVQGYSSDELPWVGPLPARPGVYVAAGYTGGGMPHCLLCGEAVADMMSGREPGRFVAAFLPSRDEALVQGRM